MLKKVICISLICAMFISFSPTVAADEISIKPTVEEILNEYHQKAFEVGSVSETATASHSSQLGTTKMTLEQETVSKLNAAGYEAYNVTSATYETLESQLDTNFDEMGLDPNHSYVLVINGEDPTSNNDTSKSGTRAIVPAPDPGGGIPYFEHTYNGTTYRMRYVTVTAAQENQLSCISRIELLDKYNVDDMLNDLNMPITILSTLGLFPYTGTIYSLISSNLPDSSNVSHSQSLMYSGGTNWTIKYTQIYNSETSKWKLCASVEQVTMRYEINYGYYAPGSDYCEFKSSSGTYGILYSPQYYNTALMKDIAADSFEKKLPFLDTIDRVDYKFNGATVISHFRWMEGHYYEPA